MILIKRASRNPKAMLVINVLVNTLVGSVKWFGGIFGHSQALLADALETTSDVFSSILILLGYNKAIQPPDHNHPYGHGKLESLISFIIGIVLVFSAGLIIYESVQTLLSTERSSPENFTLIIVLIVIVVKEILYRVFKKISQSLGSSLFYHEALHHRTDALTSLVTLLGVALALVPNQKFWYGDQVAAILASFVILYNAYRILKNSVSELMDEQNYPEVSGLIERLASEIEEIDSYEKCYVRKSGNRFYCDIHIRVSARFSVKQGHDIAHLLKDRAQASNRLIRDVHIHVEPSYD